MRIKICVLNSGFSFKKPCCEKINVGILNLLFSGSYQGDITIQIGVSTIQYSSTTETVVAVTSH